MARVIAVSAQKGGVGKTTTVVNLAAAWGQDGQRVLVVDLDAQFAATRWLGAPADPNALTVFELLSGDGDLARAARSTPAAGVDLLPARRELRKLELSLAGELHREEFVADLLADAVDAYDVVLLDCPPNLGLLTVNALVAAGEVLVPVKMTDEGAVQGAAEVRATVAQLARRAPVAIRALVRTMSDRRRIVHGEVEAGLPDLGLPIADTEIPRAADFETAAARRQPLVLFKPLSPGSLAYQRLARELAAPVATARGVA